MRLKVVGVDGGKLFLYSFQGGHPPRMIFCGSSQLWAPNTFGEVIEVYRSSQLVRRFRIASARGDFEYFSELDENGADQHRWYPQTLDANDPVFGFQVEDELTIEPRTDLPERQPVKNWDFLMWHQMTSISASLAGRALYKPR